MGGCLDRQTDRQILFAKVNTTKHAVLCVGKGPFSTANKKSIHQNRFYILTLINQPFS